ncbi:glycosyltransferase [Paraliobacillus sp. JSM ZJ581]|uniref:glycosyltransferase n=1 Tax=Paraliobacillus sp. JSM ZJ581 TaxID=3342118 RepID=UPI0035A8590E
MIDKKKIKVVYIILNGDVYGGSEKHVVDLGNLVSDNKYDKYIIYSKGNKMIKHIDKKLMSNCIAVDRNLLNIKQITNIVKKINPDILHLHAARGIFIGRIVGFICQKIYKMKLKIMTTSHGLWLPKNKNNFIYKYLMHFMKKLDKATIAVSERSKKELLEIGYKSDQVYTIYNGVDFKKFDVYRKIKKKIYNISFVGRFTEQKGIRYLMEAINDLKSNLHFHIYGEGELENYINDYIKKNQLNNVKLMGYSDNVGEVFKDTDLLIAPSINEGLPYTLVEAINCGVPIISTNVGGIPEIVEHGRNGLLIKPSSTTALVNALEEVKKMDISSFSKESIVISKKFSVKSMVESVEMVYEKVMALGGSSNE